MVSEGRLKIVADQNMPLVETLFSPYGDVHLKSGREIISSDLIDADVLLVRSVTRVSRDLLENSSVRFVGSATIGIDHIDTNFLSQSGIHFAFAPGCNANAVVQYDLSVMSRLLPNWREKHVGIIGCGNVGSRLFRALKDLNVSCRVYDPFLTPDSCFDLCGFDEVLASDIICIHTPLTHGGEYPTFHLIGPDELSMLKPGSLLLNAGRGEVISNKALLDYLKSGGSIETALDVWESEPEVCLELLEQVSIGTPHIAGNTVEGKRNGTAMVYEAFLSWIGKTSDDMADNSLQPIVLDSKEVIESISDAILSCYDPQRDDLAMRTAFSGLQEGSAMQRKAFDDLRKNYPRRREYSGTCVDLTQWTSNPRLEKELDILGFQLADFKP
jgi:erythronate-4-phosphate dehydrogenase